MYLIKIFVPVYFKINSIKTNNKKLYKKIDFLLNKNFFLFKSKNEQINAITGM